MRLIDFKIVGIGIFIAELRITSYELLIIKVELKKAGGKLVRLKAEKLRQNAKSRAKNNYCFYTFVA